MTAETSPRAPRGGGTPSRVRGERGVPAVGAGKPPRRPPGGGGPPSGGGGEGGFRGGRPPGPTLLRAAEELFGERSYHRTTVADICARAGMATGSFYSYYESKAEIFAAVVRAINTDLRRAMREALEHTDGGQRNRERAA